MFECSVFEVTLELCFLGWHGTGDGSEPFGASGPSLWVNVESSCCCIVSCESAGPRSAGGGEPGKLVQEGVAHLPEGCREAGRGLSGVWYFWITPSYVATLKPF